MEKAAFARALQFLNYFPVARGLAIVCGMAASLLFVVLLVLLTLFADLMVNRGEIPAFHDLPLSEQAAFADRFNLPEDPDHRKARLEELRKSIAALAIQDARASQLLAGSLRGKDDDLRRHLIWFLDLPELVRDRVNDDAADAVRQEVRQQIERLGLDAGVQRNLADFGILSLVVRSRSTAPGGLTALLARWCGWTWRDGNDAYLQGLFLFAILVACTRFGLAFASQYAAALATIAAVNRLRRAVYQHTYRLSTLAFRALGPSEAVSVSTRHLEAVHSGFYVWLTIWFREPIKFCLLLLFAMLVHFWLALAFLLFAIIVWLVGGQIAAYFRRQGRASDYQAANQLALLQESIMLMRLVKVYLMEKFNLARVDDQMAKHGDAQLRRYRGEAIYRPLFALLGMLAALVLLLSAGYVVLRGYLGVTGALVMTTALVSLYWPLVAWLETRRLLRRSRQSAAVLFEFLDRPGSVGQAVEAELLPALTRRLELNDVSLDEPGAGRKLLKGISCTIEAGQKVGIVGPDDMEKHALVYLVPRFLDPTAGEIRIDKKSLRWVTLDSLRAQIGMVMQHNLVFSDTVANNIACGDPLFTLQKVIEAAKVAHAHQFITKLPQGYETSIGDMGHPLRASEMFRIALARAILRDPALLIIEEPTTTLDDDSKALIDDTYSRILPGRTVLFLPHRLSTIRRCDQVLLLYEGRLEASGEHRELLSRNELYRHLQYLEFNEFAGQLSASPAPIQVEGEL